MEHTDLNKMIRLKSLHQLISWHNCLWLKQRQCSESHFRFNEKNSATVAKKFITQLDILKVGIYKLSYNYNIYAYAPN